MYLWMYMYTAYKREEADKKREIACGVLELASLSWRKEKMKKIDGWGRGEQREEDKYLDRSIDG